MRLLLSCCAHRALRVVALANRMRQLAALAVFHDDVHCVLILKDRLHSASSSTDPSPWECWYCTAACCCHLLLARSSWQSKSVNMHNMHEEQYRIGKRCHLPAVLLRCVRLINHIRFA